MNLQVGFGVIWGFGLRVSGFRAPGLSQKEAQPVSLALTVPCSRLPRAQGLFHYLNPTSLFIWEKLSEASKHSTYGLAGIRFRHFELCIS